jgi:hypothetical protein
MVAAVVVMVHHLQHQEKYVKQRKRVVKTPSQKPSVKPYKIRIDLAAAVAAVVLVSLVETVDLVEVVLLVLMDLVDLMVEMATLRVSKVVVVAMAETALDVVEMVDHQIEAMDHLEHLWVIMDTHSCLAVLQSRMEHQSPTMV